MSIVLTILFYISVMVVVIMYRHMLYFGKIRYVVFIPVFKDINLITIMTISIQPECGPQSPSFWYLNSSLIFPKQEFSFTPYLAAGIVKIGNVIY